MELYEYEVMAAVEGVHWWYRGMRALSAAWLDPLYAGRSDLQVLDAGCGTGGNGEFLGRYGAVHGLDIAPPAVALARRRLGSRLVRGSVAELPYQAERFDLVTSFDVLYHRAVLDERAALGEVVRVLRPGGRLLLRLPAYTWLSSAHDRSVHGRHRYTAGETRALIAGAGLRMERLSYINTLLFPLPVAQRLVERLVPQIGGTGSDLALPAAAVNAGLQTALLIEAAWLGAGGRFPFGLSILALAQKM